MSWARGLPGQDSVASPLQAPPSGPSGVGCPRGRVKRASFMAPGARLWAPACLTWGPVQLWPPQVPRGARFPPWWGDGHCGSWMPAPMCPSGHTGHSRPLGVAWDELGVQRRESLGLWGFPRTPSLAPRRPAPCPDTEVAMLAVTFLLFPSGWTPPLPSPPPAWARCALSGQRLPLDSCFLSRLLSEQAHVAAATTRVPAQRPWGRGRMISRLFPCQSQTLPPPRALVTGAIVLPWPRPPQLFQAICSSASHLLSLFKAVRTQAAGWGRARGRVPRGSPPALQRLSQTGAPPLLSLLSASPPRCS